MELPPANILLIVCQFGCSVNIDVYQCLVFLKMLLFYLPISPPAETAVKKSAAGS